MSITEFRHIMPFFIWYFIAFLFACCSIHSFADGLTITSGKFHDAPYGIDASFSWFVFQPPGNTGVFIGTNSTISGNYSDRVSNIESPGCYDFGDTYWSGSIPQHGIWAKACSSGLYCTPSGQQVRLVASLYSSTPFFGNDNQDSTQYVDTTFYTSKSPNPCSLSSLFGGGPLANPVVPPIGLLHRPRLKNMSRQVFRHHDRSDNIQTDRGELSTPQ